jgi:hypothetical protein
VEKIFGEFEKMSGVKILEIDTTRFQGKRLCISAPQKKSRFEI